MTLLFLTFEIDRFGSGAYIYGSMLRRNQVAKGLTRGEESLLRTKVTRVGVRESIVRGLKGTRAEEMRLEKWAVKRAARVRKYASNIEAGRKLRPKKAKNRLELFC